MKINSIKSNNLFFKSISNNKTPVTNPYAKHENLFTFSTVEQDYQFAKSTPAKYFNSSGDLSRFCANEQDYKLAKYMFDKRVDVSSIDNIVNKLDYADLKIVNDFIDKFSNLSEESVNSDEYKILTLSKDVTFKVEVDELQNNAGKQIKTTASFEFSDDIVTIAVDVTQTIAPDKSVLIERNETRSDGGNLYTISSWMDGSDCSFVSGIIVRCEEIEGQYRYVQLLNNQIKIQCDSKGSPVKMISYRPSHKLDGVFEIIEFDLEKFCPDYSKEYSFKTMFGVFNVKKNLFDSIFWDPPSVEGGKPLSRVIKNSDKSITYEENINSNACNIQRFYKKGANNTDYDYKYKISDQTGAEIFNLSRSFKKLNENKALTIINGKEFIAEYDDMDKTIKIQPPDGKEKVINIAKKIENQQYYTLDEGRPKKEEINNSKTAMQKIWNYCKNMPADLLLDIGENIDYWQVGEEVKSSVIPKAKFMQSGENYAIIAHEIGHCKNYVSDLYHDKTLIAIYNDEMKLYESQYTRGGGKDYISYFSQTSIAKETGLDELIAEANTLYTTVGMNNAALDTRTQFLAHNFPKTLAYVLNKLANPD